MATIRVAVIGAGSWGTTVASIAAENVPTTLWARRADLAEEIDVKHVNRAYLPDFVLPESLASSSDLAAVVDTADVVVMGVPSHGFRDVLVQVAEHTRAWVPVLSLTKGLEQGTRLRMTEVIGEVMPGHPAGVLTGPNLAKEIMAGQPALAVVAMADSRIAGELQRIFSTGRFRVYTNDDVVGCEVAGALKNVMALAAGMVDGMDLGDNTRSALITRGLAELSRLGVAMGGQPLTFSGLAGMGDLIATCISRQSRNRHVGEQLGRGRTLDEIIDEMNMVAEGVKTSRVVLQVAATHGVDMPIASEVVAVLDGQRTVVDAMGSLLEREAGYELEGIDP
ncbi:MAG TPA: NAD(P)H-dependent glycerol-3-phosphate dehydrogenase [Acidimicrobiales bacterium]|jgi:glycerol-3-phosphate dehydrogenase (NAD(P)+)